MMYVCRSNAPQGHAKTVKKVIFTRWGHQDGRSSQCKLNETWSLVFIDSRLLYDSLICTRFVGPKPKILNRNDFW